jgi:DNA replicative helicase MCM subunit Mcm2 (Cdc46/Mcm family)
MNHGLFEKTHLHLTRLQFPLGIQNADYETNLLLKFVKKYINYCKMNFQRPSIEAAKHYIKYQYQIERGTQNIINKVDIFDKHWDSLKYIFISSYQD